MKILLNNKIELNENSPLPFCNGDLLFFINQDKTIKLDMFSEINNSEIELLSLIYPNKLNIPLERIKKIASLFPFLVEKIYEKTGIITYEAYILNEYTSPIIVKFDGYIVCLALIGGEYARNPGTNIILLGTKIFGK